MDFLIEMYECRDSIFRGQGGNHLCNTDFDAFSLFFLLFSDGSNCAAGDLTRLFTCVTDFGCEKATSASLTAKLEQKRVSGYKTPLIRIKNDKIGFFFADFFFPRTTEEKKTAALPRESR